MVEKFRFKGNSLKGRSIGKRVKKILCKFFEQDRRSKGCKTKIHEITKSITTIIFITWESRMDLQFVELFK